MRLAIVGDQIRNFLKKTRKRDLDAVNHAISVVICHYLPEIIDIYLNPGIGFATAKKCLSVGIPYRAVVPFKDCYTVWPEQSQNEYRSYLKTALDVIYTDRQPGYILRSHPPDTFQKEKIFHMSRWMAQQLDTNDGDMLVATRVLPFHGYLPPEGEYLVGANHIAMNVISNLGGSMPEWWEDGSRYFSTVCTRITLYKDTGETKIDYRVVADDIPF